MFLCQMNFLTFSAGGAPSYFSESSVSVRFALHSVSFLLFSSSADCEMDDRIKGSLSIFSMRQPAGRGLRSIFYPYPSLPFLERLSEMEGTSPFPLRVEGMGWQTRLARKSRADLTTPWDLGIIFYKKTTRLITSRRVRSARGTNPV